MVELVTEGGLIDAWRIGFDVVCLYLIREELPFIPVSFKQNENKLFFVNSKKKHKQRF